MVVPKATVAPLATVAAWLSTRVLVPPPETMVVPGTMPGPVMGSPFTVEVLATTRVVELLLAAVVVVMAPGLVTPVPDTV